MDPHPATAMELGLAGRVAVVTGGGTGIGRAIAGAFANRGANVMICSRRLEVLETTAAELTASAVGRVLPTTADTTDIESLRSMARTVISSLGRVDILINCAASPAVLDSDEIAGADIDALGSDLNVKTLGYLRCAQVLAPYMAKNAWGRIVNIGGLTARTSDTLSGMRNVALSHLTKSLADQLGPKGITVNQINPGLVRTPHVDELIAKQAAREGITSAAAEEAWYGITPIRRMIEPIEVADLACFVSSPLAGAINGQSITIDGGLTRGIYL